MVRALVLACVLLGVPVAAAAQETRLESLTTGEAARGWEAVGRLDLAGNGFCTAVLISDTEVLTAAHCLFGEGGTRIPLDEIEFAAGIRSGRAVAWRGVRRAVIYPGYVPEASRDARRAARDLALLELDRPIRLTGLTPFGSIASVRTGSEVAVVSYGRSRAEDPALEAACSVLEAHRGTLVLSCAADFGSSGAPVFVTGVEGPRIAGIVTAKAAIESGDVSIGAALGDRVDVLRGQIAAAPGRLNGAAGQVRLLAPGERNTESGARFVRP